MKNCNNCGASIPPNACEYCGPRNNHTISNVVISNLPVINREKIVILNNSILKRVKIFLTNNIIRIIKILTPIWFTFALPWFFRLSIENLKFAIPWKDSDTIETVAWVFVFITFVGSCITLNNIFNSLIDHGIIKDPFKDPCRDR